MQANLRHWVVIANSICSHDLAMPWHIHALWICVLYSIGPIAIVAIYTLDSIPLLEG